MKPSDEYLKLKCLNHLSDQLRAVRWNKNLSSDGWISNMNMNEIGSSKPSSVRKVLEAFTMLNSRPQRFKVFKTLEGCSISYPISENFKSKISNQQNEMKPPDELSKLSCLNHSSDRLRAVRWTKDLSPDGWNFKRNHLQQ